MIIIYIALGFGVCCLAVIAWAASVMWRTEQADAAAEITRAQRSAPASKAPMTSLPPAAATCRWCTDKAFPDARQCNCRRPCGKSYCKALPIAALLRGDGIA